MDYSKYNNPIEHPEKPIRPSTPKPSASAQEHRAHADKLDQYEKEMVKYRSDKDLWQNNEAIRYDNFKKDAIEEAELTGHEAAERCWSYAWDKGHYAGFSEVMSQLYQIAEVVLGDSPATPQPLPPNPMREKVLARIADFKKEHNGFSRSSMRWKLITFGVTTIISNPSGKSEVGTHISNVNFAALSDDDLLDVFEKIIRRHYVQM